MVRLINAVVMRETVWREEKELAKLLFGVETYPTGFIAGIQDSINIANFTYARTQDIESVIDDLQGRLTGLNDEIIKCGYYYTLSYLHYINDDLILSMLASSCIKSCYKKAVTDNDWYNFIM